MRALHRRWIVAAVVALAAVAAAGTLGASWISKQQQSERVARAMTGGDPAKAPDLIRRYGCSGCHTISGIPGGDGQVGGPLSDLKKRVYVAGVAENSPDNLVRWIVDPQSFSPRSAMPRSGISEGEARDVAAYLYSN
jgi:cytochrome c2